MTAQGGALAKKKTGRGKAKAVSWSKPAEALRIARPTKEREAQDGGVLRDRAVEANSQMRAWRARCQCQLDAYLLRRNIDGPEHEAGMRVRVAWQRAVLGIRVDDSISKLQDGRDTAAVNCAEGAIEQLSQSRKLLQDVRAALSDVQHDVVIAVCGQDETAGNGRRLTELRRGLETMARHWHLV